MVTETPKALAENGIQSVHLLKGQPLDATWCLGRNLENWRPNQFASPLAPQVRPLPQRPGVAYHGGSEHRARSRDRRKDHARRQRFNGTFFIVKLRVCPMLDVSNRKQAHRSLPSMTSPPGDAVTGKSPKREYGSQTKRALTMLGAASLMFSTLYTGAADLPARLLVDRLTCRRSRSKPSSAVRSSSTEAEHTTR